MKKPQQSDTKAYRKCPDCFGTGTSFYGQGKLGVSRKCPRCKGKCKIVDDPFTPD